MHPGMCKGIIDNLEQKDEKTYLMESVTGVVNTALHSGITLNRWCQVINVLLKKYLNNLTIQQLRIIHIIKANYNLTTKIMWARRLMPRAEEANLLADSRLGSRRRKSAQDKSTVKEFYHNIAHLRLHKYASIENDLKSCYDRMVHNLLC